MKKIFFLVILVAGITQPKYAHAQSNSDEVFDIPEEKYNRQFVIELERSNRIEVSVTSMDVMEYFINIDSILKVFFNDMDKIRDSIPRGVVSVRLDYNMDDAKVKKLRLTKNLSPYKYFAIISGKPALLKMQQDTIVIHGRIPADWLRKSNKFKPADYGKYFFSVAFYMNDLEDIHAYKDGSLNEKMKIILQHYNDKWVYMYDERMQLKAYPEITSNTGKGYIFRPRTFWIKKSVEVQNYKDHFVPSISCTPLYIRQGDFIKREFGLSIEAAFSFENTATTSSKTHVNVFAGLSYNVIPLLKTSYWAKVYPDLSIAYLVSRSGTQYDKNTFRLGMGGVSLSKLTRLQPVIYFNNLFRNITPSLRIVQRF